MYGEREKRRRRGKETDGINKYSLLLGTFRECVNTMRMANLNLGSSAPRPSLAGLGEQNRTAVRRTSICHVACKIGQRRSNPITVLSGESDSDHPSTNYEFD